MATTTRSKRKQMLKEAEEAAARETNLMQETTDKNEADTSYEYESRILSDKSSITIQESDDNVISDISGLSIIIYDDAKIDKQPLLDKERKLPTKITKPKTSWIWRFFQFNEDNTKVICQINGCEKVFSWCGSPSTMKAHLSGTHQITEFIAMRYQDEELEKLDQPIEKSIKPHSASKQEFLTKNVMGFVIGTVQPLSIVEDPDFINMINGFDKIYEWEINSKIIAITTDNGSNVKKACDNVSFGKRIPCAAHTLQLSIGKGLDKMKELIGKCKHLISFLSADKKKQQLKESQVYLYKQQEKQGTDDLLKEKAESLICLDVVKANNTRWNSTLYAFQRLVLLKPAIQMLKASLSSDSSSYIRKEGEKLEELCPTVYEWKVIKEAIELLDPFEEATCLLSGIKYPTIGFTYLSMYNLRDRLETDFDSLETDEAIECRNAILKDIRERWEFPEDLCLKGSFFDPRFKSLDFVPKETCDNIINQLKEEYEVFKQNDHYTHRLSDNYTDELTKMGKFWKKKNAKVIAPIRDEFQHYLNVPELPVLEEYNPLSWWATNKNQYPILHQVAMKYLSIPATSVPSERLFSDAKNLVTPQRTRLDSSIINQLMFLKRNRNYVDIFGKAEEEI